MPVSVRDAVRQLGHGTYSLLTARRSHVHVHVDDAVKAKGDPTGTFDVRRRYKNEVELRWRKLRVQIRAAVVGQDFLGLDTNKPTSLSVVLQSLPGDGRIKAFQTWLDKTIARVVLEEDTAYLDPMITLAYTRAVTRAIGLTKAQVKPAGMSDAIAALQQLVTVEMQGIAEAYSQRAVREASNALIDGLKPPVLFRTLSDAIDAVGVVRSRAMVEQMTVQAHATGTLDQFETAQVPKVGIIPETIPVERLKAKDAALGTGPGSLVFKTQVPSRSTIGRIRRAQEIVSQLETVNVLTAGDGDVCPVCEDIADSGPYDIDEARSLIPAHPWCRCAFVPTGDARFASVFDFNPNHDPDTGEFSFSAVGYHGTASMFKNFQVRTPATRKGKDRPGIYFSADPATAHGYALRAAQQGRGTMQGRRVIAATLHMRNPLDITEHIKANQKKGMHFPEAKQAAMKLVTKKHDGVIFRGDRLNPPEYIVFHRRQIKLKDYNPNHEPAGSPEGGQFGSSEGGGGGFKSFAEHMAAGQKLAKETGHSSLRKAALGGTDLTKIEKDAIHNYTGEFGKNINNSLRSGQIRSSFPEVEHMDRALNRASFPDQHVYDRYVTRDFGKTLEKMNGKSFVDHAYVSVTDKGTGNPGQAGAGPRLVRVVIPKGGHALPIADLSNYPQEREVLVARGQTYRVSVDHGEITMHLLKK